MLNLQFTGDVDISRDQIEKLNKLLTNTVETVFSMTDTPGDHWVSVILTTDPEIHKLNLEFRGKDKPTDVLAFLIDEFEADTGEYYLGDVVISYQRALEQTEGRHKVEEELGLLTIHGILHLLGYNHHDEQVKSKMWHLQDSILSQLGSGLKSP